MRSDSLFATWCYCETFDVAPRRFMCKAATHPKKDLGPLIVIAGANSPKSVTAALHNLPVSRDWERSIVLKSASVPRVGVGERTTAHTLVITVLKRLYNPCP